MHVPLCTDMLRELSAAQELNSCPCKQRAQTSEVSLLVLCSRQKEKGGEKKERKKNKRCPTKSVESSGFGENRGSLLER